MAFDFSILENLFPQIDTHLEVELSLDGKTYQVDEFNIDYTQEVDHKGQPQHETKGGHILITLKRLPDENIYDWAKRSNKTKNGIISFISKTQGAVLRVSFFNGHCIRLATGVSSSEGVIASLYISSEKITMNDVTHDNKWRNKD